MSRRIGFVAIYLFIFILAYYLAYDAWLFDNRLNYFLESYLGNYQTYLFVFTFLLFPVIWLNRVYYVKPEILVRIKPHLIRFIVKHSIINSFQMTAIIYFSFFLSGGLILGFSLEEAYILYFRLFFQLFIFILSCFFSYHAVYVVTAKSFLSLICIVITNLLVIAAVYAFGFILIHEDVVFYTTVSIISIMYLSIAMIISLLIICLTVKKKEWYV